MGRSRGAGTSPGGLVAGRRREDDVNLVAFGGNNTSGAIEMATAVRAKGGTGHGDFESETFIVPFDTTQITHPANRSNPKSGDPCHPLTGSGHAPAVAFDWPPDVADPLTANEGSTYTHEGANNFRLHNVVQGPTLAFKPGQSEAAGGVFLTEEFAPTLQAQSNGSTAVPAVSSASGGVRRLTPRECERLQGFDDNYTLIRAGGADGPRYRALGNSMAVPVMRWIGRRIATVEAVR